MFLQYCVHCVPLLATGGECRSKATHWVHCKLSRTEKEKHPPLTRIKLIGNIIRHSCHKKNWKCRKVTDLSLCRSSMALASASSERQALSSAACALCSSASWAPDDWHADRLDPSPPHSSSGSARNTDRGDEDVCLPSMRLCSFVFGVSALRASRRILNDSCDKSLPWRDNEDELKWSVVW